MNKIERMERILQILDVDRFSNVSILSDLLGVSQMTVRRDALLLANKGQVRIVNGVIFPIGSTSPGSGADSYDIATALVENAKEKTAIGKHAAAQIEADDVLFIDAGTTTDYIVRFLPPSISLTVICCSLNVLLHLRRNSQARVLLTGGQYHHSSMMFEGPEAIDLISRNRATKAFISASGVRHDLGVTCSSYFEVEVKKSFMANSLQRMLVVDSSKFGRLHTDWFAELSDFTTVITDTGVPNEYLSLMESLDIDVQLVEKQ